VAYFNTVVENRRGKQFRSHLMVLAAVLGLVGQEVQAKDGKRFSLTNKCNLRNDTLLVSVGDGTMTAGQLLATLHMAALFHLGARKSDSYTMIPVDPTDFAAVKLIFTALAAECKPPCMSGLRYLLTCYI